MVDGRVRHGGVGPTVICMIALILSSCERAVVGTPIQAETASPTSGQVAPTSFSGKVVGVADGDTITVLVDGNREAKIRFAEIDAPEKGQPWGGAVETNPV